MVEIDFKMKSECVCSIVSLAYMVSISSKDELDFKKKSGGSGKRNGGNWVQNEVWEG